MIAEVTGAEIAAAARRWIGTPYVHQASTRGAGADCLGLIRGLWREFYGREPELVPPYSADWAEPQGEETLLKGAARYLRAKPLAAGSVGDLLVFRMRAGAVAKHLGVQVCAGPEPWFVHAYTGHGVVESPLSTPWARRIAARFEFPKRSI